MKPAAHGRVLRCLRSHFRLASAAYALSLFLCICCCSRATLAQESPATPLHQRIDALVAAGHVGPASPIASDADFVRRIYLDLTGAVPTAAETKAFLADEDPQKREKLIDRLLADVRFARHMAQTFDVMLMERRPDKYVTQAAWRKYLFDSFLANKPYDQLVREILSSDGADPATRPAAKFVLDRDAEPNLLARDVGRVFFGQDLQCAQCHDHPLVEDYQQSDYYGLYAFFSRTQLFTQPDKLVVLMDNLEGEVGFESVFDKGNRANTLPRVIGGKELEEPRLPPGQEWVVAPAKDVRHVPKYSRRAQLAAQVADPNNRPFARNIANRLWAHMLGRGIVEPVDFHHVGNPPSNAELLDALSESIVELKFDMRAFLREIALSQTYQRAIELPESLPEHAAIAKSRAEALTEELAKLTEAQQSATETYNLVLTEVTNARRALPPLVDAVAQAKAAMAEVQKGIAAAEKALADVQTLHAAKHELQKQLADAAAKTKDAAAKLSADPKQPDKELVEAAVKVEAKAAQVAAEIETIAKQVEEKTAAVKAAAEKAPAAQEAIDAALTKLEEARKGLIALEEREVAAEEARRAAEFALSQRRQMKEEIEALNAFAAAVAGHTDAQASAKAAEAAFVAAQAEQKKLAEEIAQFAAAQQTAQKASAEAQAAVQAAQQQVAHREKAAAILQQLQSQVAAAAAVLPSDPELPTLAASLSPKRDAVVQELVAAQKALAASQETLAAAISQMQIAQENSKTAAAKAAELEKSAAEAQAAAQQAAAEVVAAREKADAAADTLANYFSSDFASRPLRHLTPEQLGWSILRTTGVYDAYWAQTEAEIEKATPLSEEAKKDPSQLAARNLQIEQAVYDKLMPTVNTFIHFYGAGAGQPQTDFFATVDQALFIANGTALKSWLAPSGENLTGRLVKIEDPTALSEELYLSVLSRKPTSEEAADVAAYLAARPNDRAVAIQELAWGLISSAEYRFNH